MQTPTREVLTERQNNTISHYNIGKTIGEGTFGKVKIGNDMITRESVRA
jgi:hypothetical protein